MTVCIAAKTEAGVWLATDSLVSGTGVKDYCGPKWIEMGGIVVAYAGDDEQMSRLRGSEEIEDLARYPGGDVLPWVEEYLLPVMRKIVPDAEDMPEMMAVYSGQIVVFGGGGGAYETKRDYAAIGVGAACALGAYSALMVTEMSVQDKLVRAVNTAIEHAEDCGGQVCIRFQPS